MNKLSKPAPAKQQDLLKETSLFGHLQNVPSMVAKPPSFDEQAYPQFQHNDSLFQPLQRRRSSRLNSVYAAQNLFKKEQPMMVPSFRCDSLFNGIFEPMSPVNNKQSSSYGRGRPPTQMNPRSPSRMTLMPNFGSTSSVKQVWNTDKTEPRKPEQMMASSL